MPDTREAIYHTLIALAVWLGIGASASGLFAQAGVDGRYSEPNFEMRLFARENLLLEPQEISASVAALTSLAANFPGAEEVDHRLRAKALAIALRLDGTSPDAIATNRQLRKGGQPAAVSDFDTIAEVASALWAIANFLETPEKSKDESVLQFCLVDIAREIDPSNLADSNRYPTQLPKATFPGWAPILSGGETEFVFPDKEPPIPAPKPDGPNPVAPDNADVAPAKPTHTAQGTYFSIGVNGNNAELAKLGGDLKADGSTAPLAIIFSDEAGETNQALNKQRKAITSALTELEGSWPNDGGVLVLSVASGYGDDNALALPAAILADSLIRERDLDPKTIALGIVAPEGSIAPVDRVYQRLQPFRSTGVETILVPAENLPELRDIALLGEFDTFFRFQFILVGSLKQAAALADAERDENNESFAKSHAAFKMVQEIAKENVLSEFVSLSVVTERLAEIVASFPDHASAKILYEYGTGKLPKTLTRGGSLAALYRATGPVVAAMQTQGSAERQTVVAAYEEVGRIQPILEAETRELGEMMRGLLKDIGNYANFADKTSAPANELKTKIFATWESVRSEYTRLKNG